ncbi:hypothetical protein GCM10027262_04030 [Nocardia tengchongensis]
MSEEMAVKYCAQVDIRGPGMGSNGDTGCGAGDSGRGDWVGWVGWSTVINATRRSSRLPGVEPDRVVGPGCVHGDEDR